MGELRDEDRDEILDVVAQVRAHLELQRALGVTSVEIPRSGVPSAHPPQEPVVADTTGPLREPSTVPATERSHGLAAIAADLEGCTRCKLSTGRRSIVFGEGKPDAVLVFIGEGPGQEEDEQGRPFVGAAGQLLTDIIEKGMQLRRADMYICNIVKCRPPENRKPEPDEIATCRTFLDRQLAAINPSIIIALGNVAAQTLLGTGEGITKLRGTWQRYRGIRVMPTYHPAYLLRNPAAKKDVWADIRKVLAELGSTKKG